jgi:phosphoribosyl-AMP cyclohydrolase
LNGFFVSSQVLTDGLETDPAQYYGKGRGQWRRKANSGKKPSDIFTFSLFGNVF